MKPKKNELENNLKRALADYQNLKKRSEEERAILAKFSASVVLAKLLPVLDDLKRAQAHLQDPGLDLAVKQFLTVLVEEGVKEINLLNQPFNPQFAECTEMVPGPKNQVMEVINQGYTLYDRILRPAKVKVGKGDSAIGG
ncbi:MAG: nucleotide exchange factor GrpE [Patescibacteria group bacterium]